MSEKIASQPVKGYMQENAMYFSCTTGTQIKNREESQESMENANMGTWLTENFSSPTRDTIKRLYQP